VIVDDLYFEGVAVREAEADTPWVVDTDAALACPISLEMLEPVVRRRSKVVKAGRSMDHLKLSFRDRSDIDPAGYPFAGEQRGRCLATEALDHCAKIYRIALNARRIGCSLNAPETPACASA
jgi:hypothetical protein